MPRPATIARRCELFEEAAAIIALEFSGPVSLQELARRLATSPRQLQRAFAEAGEPGPRAYLRRVRMKRAAELLRDGSTVGQAAWLVGYSQPAQFAKAFRIEHGHLPREARRHRVGLPSSDRLPPETFLDV
jgi:AraC-like DNA-binding protein